MAKTYDYECSRVCECGRCCDRQMFSVGRLMQDKNRRAAARLVELVVMPSASLVSAFLLVFDSLL